MHLHVHVGRHSECCKRITRATIERITITPPTTRIYMFVHVLQCRHRQGVVGGARAETPAALALPARCLSPPSPPFGQTAVSPALLLLALHSFSEKSHRC